MCAQQWTEIDLSSAPSLAMARYKRAFLNDGKGCCKDDPAPRVETTSSKCFRKRESRRSKASTISASVGRGSAHAQKPRTFFRGRGFCGSLACLERAVGVGCWSMWRPESPSSGSGAVGSYRGRQRGRTRLHGSMGRAGAVRFGRSPGRRSRVRWRKQASWPLAAQHDIPNLLVMTCNASKRAETICLKHLSYMQFHLIFWNVRADTYGYLAAADQKGVMLLSGYSPALMKFILWARWRKRWPRR
jgi:hypothetical protein